MWNNSSFPYEAERNFEKIMEICSFQLFNFTHKNFCMTGKKSLPLYEQKKVAQNELFPVERQKSSQGFWAQGISKSYFLRVELVVVKMEISCRANLFQKVGFYEWLVFN